MSANPQSPQSEIRIPQCLYACLFRPSGAGDLVAIAQDFSPRFEVLRDDRVAIDVTGLGRLLGPARAIGAELRRTAAARGVCAHVAIAATRMAAMVLAQARPGLTVVEPGTEAAVLAPMPIGLLETIADQSPSTPRTSDQNDAAVAAVAAFTRWGVRTFGELAALPPADLAARLGQQGRVWQAIARGEDVRPLVPMIEAERFESSLELEWPIDGLEPLSFVLTRLLEPLSTRLERRDRGAAVLHVVLRLVTRETVLRSLQLPSPMRDVRTLRTLALLDLESHPPGAAIDRVQIVIDPTPGRVLQHTLFTRAHPTAEQISTLLARLGALMGQDRIGAPAIVDSYRPGAFVTTPFPTQQHDQRRTRGSRGATMPEDSVRAASPERSAISPEPRAPSPERPVVTALRRCRQPVPARVAESDGRPVRVTSDRRGFGGGAVLQCAGPWRTSGEWWETEGGEAGRAGGAGRVGPWDRDEWDVALGDGAVYRICHDRAADAWFIDAIVD